MIWKAGWSFGLILGLVTSDEVPGSRFEVHYIKEPSSPPVIRIAEVPSNSSTISYLLSVVLVEVVLLGCLVICLSKLNRILLYH